MNEDEKDLLDRDGEEGEERSEADIEGVEARGDSADAEQRDADDTGDAEAKLPNGVKKRLSKLTAQKRDAEAKRDAALAELQSYRAKEREAQRRAEAEAARTPEGQEARRRAALLRQYNDEAYGEGYSDWVERERAEREAERQLQKEQYALNGVSYLKSELEDYGIPVDDRTLVSYEKAVGSELQEDAELFAMFRRPATQKEAIAEAMKRVVDGVANPILKLRGADPLKRIERNRAAVLGSPRSQAGAEEGTPYPENYTAKPPKNATPAEAEEFWRNHRDQMWTKLNARSA